MRHRVRLTESVLNSIVREAVKMVLNEGSAESDMYVAAMRYYREHGHYPGQPPYDDSEERAYERKKERLRQMVKSQAAQIEGKYVEDSHYSQGGSALATHVVLFTNYKDYSTPFRLKFVHWGRMTDEERENSISLGKVRNLNKTFDTDNDF